MALFFSLRDHALRDQFLELGGDDELAVALVFVGVVIILMIILRGIKRLERNDLGDNRVLEPFGGFGFGGFGGRFLRVVAVKDDGAVLGAMVGALAVEGGGIVGFPEDFQQLVVGENGGIKFDLDHFGVAGGAGADLFIAWVGHGAAGKAGSDGFDAGDALEDRFGAPETAAPNGGGFHFGGRIGGLGLCIHNGDQKAGEGDGGEERAPPGRLVRVNSKTIHKNFGQHGHSGSKLQINHGRERLAPSDEMAKSAFWAVS